MAKNMEEPKFVRVMKKIKNISGIVTLAGLVLGVIFGFIPILLGTILQSRFLYISQYAFLVFIISLLTLGVVWICKKLKGRFK